LGVKLVVSDTVWECIGNCIDCFKGDSGEFLRVFDYCEAKDFAKFARVVVALGELEELTQEEGRFGVVLEEEDIGYVEEGWEAGFEVLLGVFF